MSKSKSSHKHTPGPWKVENGDILSLARHSEGERVARVNPLQRHAAREPEYSWKKEETQANAARIVACVNALEGIDDPAEFQKQRDKYLKQRDELLTFAHRVAVSFDAHKEARLEAYKLLQKAYCKCTYEYGAEYRLSGHVDVGICRTCEEYQEQIDKIEMGEDMHPSTRKE